MVFLKRLENKWYIQLILLNGTEVLISTGNNESRSVERIVQIAGEDENPIGMGSTEWDHGNEGKLFVLIDEYQKWCHSRVRPETYKSYLKALRNLRECWGDISIHQIGTSHISKLQEFLTERLNPTTTNIRIRSIKAFLNWLVRVGHLERLPFRISQIPVDDRLPSFFTPVELGQIMAAISNPKMKAVIILLAETGLRRSEILHCTLGDGYLHLFQTKGRKERLVPLPPELVSEFKLATENPYEPDSISKAFLEAMRKAGIERKGRTLHCLRHTFALREYYRTGDIYFVKDLLGHSSVTVTEKYLRFPQEYLKQVFGPKTEQPENVESHR